MKLLLSVLLLSIALSSVSGRRKWHELEDYDFEQYMSEFGKDYDDEEYHMRKEIFDNRLREINKHNADPTQTWKRGINHMSDYTEEEFKRLRGYRKELNYNSASMSSNRRDVEVKPIPIHRGPKKLPAFVDYRKKGVISNVKDQGGCGSCWTFATVETIESYHALLTGDLPVLSEQQILDCTPNPQECGGTGGCMGGTSELALAHLIKMGGGIASEWTYPYKSYNGAKFNCSFDDKATPGEAVVTGYKSLGKNVDPEEVMEHLHKVGPLAVSVDASLWSDYEEGVFNGCNQTNPDLDHLVQLVGYGTVHPKGPDYWIIRNSWRPSWGEHGFMRLQRTSKQTKQCGTDLNPLDGDGCKGGPPTVEVCGTCGVLFDPVYPIVAKPSDRKDKPHP